MTEGNSTNGFDTFGDCRLCQKSVDDVRHEAQSIWNWDRDEGNSTNSFDTFGDCRLCQKSVDDVRDGVFDGIFSRSLDTICYQIASPSVSKVRDGVRGRYLLTQAALAVCVKSPWTNSWRTLFSRYFWPRWRSIRPWYRWLGQGINEWFLMQVSTLKCQINMLARLLGRRKFGATTTFIRHTSNQHFYWKFGFQVISQSILGRFWKF